MITYIRIVCTGTVYVSEISIQYKYRLYWQRYQDGYVIVAILYPYLIFLYIVAIYYLWKKKEKIYSKWNFVLDKFVQSMFSFNFILIRRDHCKITLS